MTLASSGFVVPATGEQGSIRIDDVNAANYNALTGPYEVIYFTGNNTGTNTLSGFLRGQDGTSPHSFLAGARITQVPSAGALNLMTARFVKVIVSVSTPSVTISSIPNTFSALRLTWYAVSDQAAPQDLAMQFNGDTATNYNYGGGYVVNGSTAFGGFSQTSVAYARAGSTATNAAGAIAGGMLTFPNYTSTTRRKFMTGTAYLEAPGTKWQSEWSNSEWINTAAAISSMKLYSSTGNLVDATFTIEGIQ